jgi:hypothetical protein
MLFVIPAIGLFLARGRLVDHVLRTADEFGVVPIRASHLASRAVMLLSGSFLLMGAVLFAGDVPHPGCLYSFNPLRWPVVAMWAVTGVLWAIVVAWLWLAPEKEVLLLLSGVFPRTGLLVYRVGAVAFIVLTLVATLAVPTDVVPCPWN